MTIGIVLHPYGEKKPSGLGRYIFELTKTLLEQDKENKYIIYLKNKSQKLPDLNGNYKIKILGWRKFWLDLGLFFAPRADIYIFNTPRMPLFFKPKKSIVIALDFAYKYFKPGRPILSFINKLALEKCERIISVSQATKNDIIKFFKIPEEKIKVIYPGFNNICSLSPKTIEISGKYFLYVGVIKERKNLLNAVRAFCEFKKKDSQDYKLFIIGKKGGEYYEKINDFIKNNKLEKEIIFLDFIDDNELSYIYKNAQVLVFPSMIEGFGFTILEAMSCGLPVITSNCSSMAEVGDEAVLLVDPKEIESISNAMEKIVNNEDIRKKLIQKGYEQIKNFSWQKSAEEFIDLFKKI